MKQQITFRLDRKGCGGVTRSRLVFKRGFYPPLNCRLKPKMHVDVEADQRRGRNRHCLAAFRLTQGQARRLGKFLLSVTEGGQS